MTTVAALKALYVALGGDADAVADMVIIPDVISAITTLISAGGGILPKVSATDNGDVLTVVEGAWAAAAPAAAPET